MFATEVMKNQFIVLSHWNITPQAQSYDIPPGHVILATGQPVFAWTTLYMSSIWQGSFNYQFEILGLFLGLCIQQFSNWLILFRVDVLSLRQTHDDRRIVLQFTHMWAFNQVSKFTTSLNISIWTENSPTHLIKKKDRQVHYNNKMLS